MLHTAPISSTANAPSTKPKAYARRALRLLMMFTHVAICVLVGNLIVEAPPMNGEQLVALALVCFSVIMLLVCVVVSLNRHQSLG